MGIGMKMQPFELPLEMDLKGFHSTDTFSCTTQQSPLLELNPQKSL